MSGPPSLLRAQMLTLLTHEEEAPLSPGVYDRLEAWWYGAAPNSRRAFAADLRCWRAFCEATGAAFAPASPVQLRAFVRARHQAGARAASISRQLASLATLHALIGHLPSPTRDPLVRGELKGVRRAQGVMGRGAPRQARGLRLKGDVADIFADAPQPLSVLALLTTLPATPAGLRDRVLLHLGTDLGRRRSEYAALTVGDVAAAPDGSGTIRIRRSKTDQAGAGQVKYLSPEAMAAIADWLALRAQAEGPLLPSAPLLTSVDRFGRIGARLSDDGVRDVLRRIARRGLAQLQPELGPEALEAAIAGLSGHSFRVGFAQDLVAAGAEMPAICQAADWRSPEMPVRYARALAARSGAVARLRAQLKGG